MVDGINDGESTDLLKSFKQIDTAPASSGKDITLSDTLAEDTTIDMEKRGDNLL